VATPRQAQRGRRVNLWAAQAELGALRVVGRDRVDLLHRISTNDLRPLAEPGRSLATVFTNEKGRIVDWVTIVSLPDQLLLRTSPGRAAALATWIERYTIMEDVRCTDVSSELGLVVVQGAERLVDVNPPAGGVATVGAQLWTRGLAAFGPRLEAVVPRAELPVMLGALEKLGPIRGARDLELARLLAGVPSPEHEFKDDVNPLELRINRDAISWTKGCYIGQEVIARLDSYDKLARQLVGVEATTAPPGDELRLTRQGRPLGRVTSLLRAERGVVGLAVVKREAAGPGDAELVGEAGSVAARLVDRPFWSD
jgi:tRNA-modifying protein YgfZ